MQSYIVMVYYAQNLDNSSRFMYKIKALETNLQSICIFLVDIWWLLSILNNIWYRHFYTNAMSSSYKGKQTHWDDFGFLMPDSAL